MLLYKCYLCIYLFKVNTVIQLFISQLQSQWNSLFMEWGITQIYFLFQGVITLSCLRIPKLYIPLLINSFDLHLKYETLILPLKTVTYKMKRNVFWTFLFIDENYTPTHLENVKLKKTCIIIYSKAHIFSP